MTALFTDENGAVRCAGHRPSSDFRTDRLSMPEVAEWTAFIAAQYGPDASPCEDCRHGSPRRRNAAA